jgi:hypothetical protein
MISMSDLGRGRKSHIEEIRSAVPQTADSYYIDEEVRSRAIERKRALGLLGWRQEAQIARKFVRGDLTNISAPTADA